MLARIGKMKDQIGVKAPREVARCPKCGEVYSAKRGDYFNLPDNAILKCANDHAPTNCELVIPVHTYRPVKD